MAEGPGFVDRRKGTRMALRVPVRVQGHDADGTPWSEMAITEDADSGGAAIMLRRVVRRGQVLLLTLPLPKRFRAYDPAAASYAVYAVIRNAHPSAEGQLRVGVMFLGRHPPKAHAQNPGGLYLLENDVVAGAAAGRPLYQGAERRAHARYDIAVQLTITRPEPVAFGATLDQAATRNIGIGGALVPTALPLTRGDVVMVRDLQGILKTRAEVRGLFIGKDNMPLLNLKFLDAGAADAVRALLRQHKVFE
jgi:hypothetical protein